MHTIRRLEAGSHGPGPRRRTGVVGLAATAAAATAASVLLGLRCAALVTTPVTGATTVDRWVELGAVAAGAAAAAWLAASALLALACVGTALLGRSWQAGEAALHRVAPGAVRRMARAAVGVGVGAGLVLVPATAHAAPEGEEPPAPPPASVTEPIDLSWQPTSGSDGETAPAPEPGSPEPLDAAGAVAAAEVERTSATTATSTRSGAAGPRLTEQGSVVVHRGDTLWDIVAATLDAGATDAEVLREVVRWHEANRDVIGADPDLILPGQVLRAPR